MHTDPSAPRLRTRRAGLAALALLLAPVAAAPAAAQGNVPTIASLDPVGAAAGAPGFTLQVTGARFRSGATVRWNGQNRATTRLDDGRLRATIAAGDVAAAGTAQITVHVPRGQGATSAPAAFRIVAPPVLGSVTPTRFMAGGDAASLIVQGSDFAPGARILWAGSPRATTGTATRLTAAIPASDLARPRNVAITVMNPGATGATSATRTVAVVHERPDVSSLSPSSATQNASGLELSVRGGNFVRAGTTVLWNGVARPTSYISRTEVRAAIPASDLARAGIGRVEVRTQVDNSVKTSGTVEFTVRPTVIVAVPARALLGISSFRLRDGAPFATPGARVTLDATTLGNPSLYRAARRSQSCATDLASVGWRSYSSAAPPAMDFASTGTHTVCFQIGRGDAASPTSAAPVQASIRVVEWLIQSPRMGSGQFIIGIVPTTPRDLIRQWPLGIGLDVRAGSLIDQVALRMARLGSAGEHSGATTSGAIGGTGGKFERLVCPGGQAMVGVRGRRGLVLDRIEIACRRFRQEWGTYGSTTWIGPVGGSGGNASYSFVCPPPHAVFDVNGAVIGSYVSGLQLVCLPPDGL